MKKGNIIEAFQHQSSKLKGLKGLQERSGLTIGYYPLVAEFGSSQKIGSQSSLRATNVAA